nr:hypothetical protein [Butyricicoccus sp. OF13-6]
MGLIKAAAGAGGGVLADQWKEYFYCDAINADVLAVKGRKKVTRRSSNTKGDEDIITSGSVIAVADGQAMMIVDQARSWKPRSSRVSSSTIRPPSRLFSPVRSVTACAKCSPTWPSASRSAEKRRARSASTISTPRS